MFLPVYLVIGYAIGARRAGLLVLGALVAALHVWLAWPDIRPAAQLSADVRSAPQLKVYSVNVFFLNPDNGPLLGEFMATDADVGVFVEAIEPHRWALEEDVIVAKYPYRVESPLGRSANVIVSRLPILDSGVITYGSRSGATARVMTDAGPVRILAVHTSAPANERNVRLWNAQFDDLERYVESVDEPLVLAGDFNATAHHRRLRDLVARGGFTDAQSARGLGLHGTFPRNRWYPPLLRIDHVLASRGLVPTDFELLEGRNSDHRPIVATLALVGLR